MLYCNIPTGQTVGECFSQRRGSCHQKGPLGNSYCAHNANGCNKHQCTKYDDKCKEESDTCCRDTKCVDGKCRDCLKIGACKSDDIICDGYACDNGLVINVLGQPCFDDTYCYGNTVCNTRTQTCYYHR